MLETGNKITNWKQEIKFHIGNRKYDYILQTGKIRVSWKYRKQDRKKRMREREKENEDENPVTAGSKEKKVY